MTTPLCADVVIFAHRNNEKRKHMKHHLICMLAVFCPALCAAQVTLEQCKAWAADNYPVIRQYALVEQSRRFTVENAMKAWLPQVSVNGTVSYQSDVTSIPIELPDVDIPKIGKDQYDVNITLSQQVYDGGADVEHGKVSVAMYDVNQRVDQLFFGVLVLDEQIRQVRVLQDDLSLSLSSVEAMMKGGVANQADVDAVKVEQVKARQKETSLLTQRKTYMKMLSTFTGKYMGEKDSLAMPQMPALLPTDNRRPELELYAAQNSLIDTKLKALYTDLRPHVGVYARGGYGNPGLNMLKDDFDAYYKVGLTLSWNFGSLYTRANDKKKLEAERQTVQSERDAFLFNTRLQTELQSGAIASLREQIKQDDEIITLRQRIREKAGQRVANGTETVNEMLRDINAVSDAQLAKRLHEIQLLQEIYKVKHLNNI